MVKRIKKRVASAETLKLRELYADLEDAMVNASNFSDIFDRFLKIVELKIVGSPTQDKDLEALIAAIGREGLGGLVMTETPEVGMFRSLDPPMIHGSAIFGQELISFVILPKVGRGLAARAEGGMMHYQRFSTTVLPGDANLVPGTPTVH